MNYEQHDEQDGDWNRMTSFMSSWDEVMIWSRSEEFSHLNFFLRVSLQFFFTVHCEKKMEEIVWTEVFFNKSVFGHNFFIPKLHFAVLFLNDWSCSTLKKRSLDNLIIIFWCHKKSPDNKSSTIGVSLKPSEFQTYPNLT